ncbi:hypothetical protein CHS0354_027961 [Potamilus streckersoni]|uniref:Uncharacterized protein n=1 Tax=Potamilus streckersoni TaxID=2493646 RepID=A0AAE0W7Z3_9BIVA|nr:hypothetical protein CHS0354_027961 [Potamilus streckersoni]
MQRVECRLTVRNVKICKACVADTSTKAIAMCTVGSVTGSSILLTTAYVSVNTCVCTIEANSGPFFIVNTDQPASPDCGSRIDITNNNESISTTFQCQQQYLYQFVGVSISLGEITLHKQSNGTEDDIRYCLLFSGPAITITCYGTDSQPSTTSTTKTTTTTTVRSSTTTSATKIPTTVGIISTSATTTTQKPLSKSLPTSSDTSKHTTELTWGTTNRQGDNADIIVGRKDRDLDIVLIVAPILGLLCVTAVVIIVIFLCRRNARKRQMEEDERNDSYANLSNDREGNSNYEALNNMQILSVPVDKVMYENVTS